MKQAEKSANRQPLDLRGLPGHVTRRVHQLAVALFVEEMGELNVTPVQYSSLQTICNQPGIDQKTVAASIGLDTSTVAGVIDRLEARGLVLRKVAPHDRRARQVYPTDEGRRLLEEAFPRMLRSQTRLLEPLQASERAEFMRLMKTLIDANAELSNRPTRD